MLLVSTANNAHKINFLLKIQVNNAYHDRNKLFCIALLITNKKQKQAMQCVRASNIYVLSF